MGRFTSFGEQLSIVGLGPNPSASVGFITANLFIRPSITSD